MGVEAGSQEIVVGGFGESAADADGMRADEVGEAKEKLAAFQESFAFECVRGGVAVLQRRECVECGALVCHLHQELVGEGRVYAEPVAVREPFEAHYLSPKEYVHDFTFHNKYMKLGGEIDLYQENLLFRVKKEQNTCKALIRSLDLHRVFHSIRFKVNKGWVRALTLFFVFC